MKLTMYIIIAIIGTYVSAEGHRISYGAIDNAGEAGSLALFEYGQWVYLIAGSIAVMFAGLAAMNIINRIWRD